MKPVIGVSVNYIGPEEEKCPSRWGSFYINRSYVDQIRRAGGLPLYLPYTEDPAELAMLFERIDGLLLTGGKDMDPSMFGEDRHPSCERILPDRSRSDVGMTRLAIQQEVPILGICLGLQTLNVALGGSLYQDIPSQLTSNLTHRQAEPERHQPAHTVQVKPKTLLHRILGRDSVDVNSIHHQCANRIGQGLIVSALAPDGVVEGLEYPGVPYCVSVQWHPEDMQQNGPHGALFESLMDAARDYRQGRRGPVRA